MGFFTAAGAGAHDSRLLLGPRLLVRLVLRRAAALLRQHRAHVLAELDLDVDVVGGDRRRRVEVVPEVVVERHVAANVRQQVRVALLSQHAAQRLAEPLLEEPERCLVEVALLLLGRAFP
jgi:hypothetical protein